MASSIAPGQICAAVRSIVEGTQSPAEMQETAFNFTPESSAEIFSQLVQVFVSEDPEFHQRIPFLGKERCTSGL